MDVATQLIVQVLPVLVTVLAPIITSAVKAKVPSIPRPLIPLTSVAVGTAAGYAAGLGAADGAILGAVGVAVREVLDQVKKAVDAPTG
jgi:hypothetical protein